MGILDKLLGRMTGTGTAALEPQQEGQADLVSAVLQMLGQKGSGGIGGLGGLISAFQNKGLGDVVSSWVSTGENLPVTPDQVQHGLGRSNLEQMAEQLGIPAESLASKLAPILPVIVDKLTPEGRVPEGGVPQSGDLLGQILGTFTNRSA